MEVFEDVQGPWVPWYVIAVRQFVPGPYDLLITKSRREQIEELPDTLTAETEDLGIIDSVDYLAKEIASRLRRTLRKAQEDLEPDAFLIESARLLNSIEVDSIEFKVLTEIRSKIARKSSAPIMPLGQSALVTNDQRLNYHAVLRSELATANRVDWICPFIGSQGLNLILDLLRELGPRLRVITTTYLGGTHRQAIERLVKTGAHIKIAYERAEQKTALHAKAWIFHRETGFSTATIGSSNLSPKALVDGLEWNLRISGVDSPVILDELTTTFDRLWFDDRFDVFDSARDGERLSRALSSQRGENPEVTFFVDVHPFRHQQTALDSLRLARLDGKHRNLIVAATGTGKTLISAFDYAELSASLGGRPNLLFVAHREDILKQARSAFRMVLRDGDFGELNVGSHKADRWKHVFASVQSLHSNTLSQIDPSHFVVVVIDEFHHAEAPTYRRILEHLEPVEVVGLTATPERADGNDDLIKSFGSFAYELRLWEALDAGLVSPFHYFGIDDGLDLSDIRWEGGRYDVKSLEERLDHHAHQRFAIVMRELFEKVEDVQAMRAVVFCVSTRHANKMATQFVEHGLNAAPLHSDLPKEVRELTMSRFRSGDLNLVCTVDLLNEGIDVPEIDTVIFLRPTESAVVFTQQLGRGLRLQRDKGALTVLDFVGQQNKRFRLDLRYRALTGLTRTELGRAIENEFPLLPAGCHIRLDKVSRERALRNLKDAVPSRRADLVLELRRLNATDEQVTVDKFLKETGLDALEFYNGKRSLQDLRAEISSQTEQPDIRQHRLASMSHINDSRRIAEYKQALVTGEPSVYARMVAFPLGGSVRTAGISAVLRDEALELLDHLSGLAAPLPAISSDLPYALHASYSRDEIVAPFRDDPSSMREGTFYVEALGLDIHMFTLRKSERFFSPNTMYKDKVISHDLVQWESQSRTTQASPTGKRLITGEGRHLLFARENRLDTYHCLGFAKPQAFAHEQPILITWKLDSPISDEVYPRFLAAN
ncbi:MAG: DUF3427 domain-containing protein [Chlorobia bacterium]|nr:DUF3427 domain-containing protein [Fimbriimonadaceae bacterium]